MTRHPNYPILKCLHCQETWKRTKRGPLKPSRNCPFCYVVLKLEGEDYEWIDYGRHAFNVQEAQAFNDLNSKNNSRRRKEKEVEPERKDAKHKSLPTAKLPDLFTILNPNTKLKGTERKLLES